MYQVAVVLDVYRESSSRLLDPSAHSREAFPVQRSVVGGDNLRRFLFRHARV